MPLMQRGPDSMILLPSKAAILNLISLTHSQSLIIDSLSYFRLRLGNINQESMTEEFAIKNLKQENFEKYANTFKTKT